MDEEQHEMIATTEETSTQEQAASRESTDTGSDVGGFYRLASYLNQVNRFYQ